MRLRDPGIAWSYYSTDPEWGLMQAKSVIVELEEALAAHDVCHVFYKVCHVLAVHRDFYLPTML